MVAGTAGEDRNERVGRNAQGSGHDASSPARFATGGTHGALRLTRPYPASPRGDRVNELHPRKVEAGALRRWFGEALELMTRRFWLWLIATALFTTLRTVATLFPVLLLVPVIAAASILGLSYGVLVAAYADRRANLEALPTSLTWRTTTWDAAEFRPASSLAARLRCGTGYRAFSTL